MAKAFKGNKNLGRRSGAARIVPKSKWYKRKSIYKFLLASGLFTLGIQLWLNDGSGGLDDPWDNNSTWLNRS